MRLVVLGGGMQGRVIAANLAERPDVRDVVVADIREPQGMPKRARFVTCDALDPASVARALNGAHAAVVALPSAIGRAGLQNAIRAGIPLVDISFTADTLADLDDDARRSGATVVADCGVAPGLSHLLAGAAYHALGGMDKLVIRVGGIPLQPPLHFRHAVYFNPNDLIAEYYRPARLRRGGRLEAPQPLEAPVERYQDKEMGEHEAFVSDGLRTLLTSYPDVPDMIELTLRRSGHLDFMRTLRATGFLDTHPLAPGTEPPASSTARILAARYPEALYPDYLLMTVEAERAGRRMAWRLVDRRVGDMSAMTRTTGFTAAAVAMQLAKRRFDMPGLHAPERLGADAGLVRDVLADLAERGVRVDAVA